MSKAEQLIDAYLLEGMSDKDFFAITKPMVAAVKKDTDYVDGGIAGYTQTFNHKDIKKSPEKSTKENAQKLEKYLMKNFSKDIKSIWLEKWSYHGKPKTTWRVNVDIKS